MTAVWEFDYHAPAGTSAMVHGRTRLREAAIDETLRHAVRGEDVPSRSAQQAWTRYGAHQLSLGAHEPGTALRAGLAAGEPLISIWLQARSAWTACR